MFRKFTLLQITKFTDDNLLQIKRFDEFDAETVVLIYSEVQRRNLNMSPDVLINLLDFTSKNGWDDVTAEVTKYITQRGFSSYEELRESVNELITVDSEPKNGPLGSNDSPVLMNSDSSIYREKLEKLEIQLEEVVTGVSSAGDAMKKFYGSMLGQFIALLAYILMLIVSQDYYRKSIDKEYASQNLSIIYVLVSVFFLIRMFVFISKASSRLHDIRFLTKRHR